MNSDASTVFLTFPPRAIGDEERETVKQWLAGTTDIASAYASERRGDDPAHYRRIVIVETGARQPNYLLHCPDGTDVWLMTIPGERDSAQLFTSLRAALHAIRPMSNAGVRTATQRIGGAASLAARGGSVSDGSVSGGSARDGSGNGGPLSDGPARTIGEMAAGLRRPLGGNSAAAMPRRKPT